MSIHEIIGILGWGPRHAGWTDGQTDGLMEQWMEGSVDRWMDSGKYERRGEGNE